MKTPRQIYAEYNIMPSLQLHQLRVAAVAKLVCRHLTKPINEHEVILACFFHDMGNVIKSDISHFPDFTEPEGIEYWQKVKDGFIQKYGSDSHAATETIAKEIGLSENIISIIDSMRFSRSEEIRARGSWELKVSKYSDLRVGPRGVLPLKERLEEASKRYTRKDITDRASEEESAKLFEACFAIERQLEEAGWEPAEATDERIAPLVEELWDLTVGQ
ncbi:MAG: HD domain-containing protein [bacterium]|nr:HD domain-containing protein [bacterium]